MTPHALQWVKTRGVAHSQNARPNFNTSSSYTYGIRLKCRWNFIETYYKQEIYYYYYYYYYYFQFCIVDEVVVIHKDDQSKFGYQQKFTVF